MTGNQAKETAAPVNQGKEERTPPPIPRKYSVLDQLDLLDEANHLSFKENYDESVLKFVKKWQKLVQEYGYKEIMMVEFFKADHPYPEPVFPIKIMDEDTYMTNHYSSVAAWKRKPKRRTVFHVIEIRDAKVIGGINITGPFNEYTLFQAFVDICIYTETLTVIRLINCSLKKEGVMMLAECLPRTRVTHLYLDRNPIPDEDYSSILTNNTTLVHLSLSMCKIGFRGMRALSRVLGPYEGLRPNQRLKSLALDNNSINCLAIKSFSECLRWNTDLVFLSLAGNIIGDQGLEYLSKSFYMSELSQKEINMMNCRHIDRLKELEDIINEELHLPIVEIPNQEVDIFENDGGLKNLFDEDTLLSDIDPIRMHVLQKTCDEFLEMDPNPLVANVTLCNGKLIGTGNYTLNVLNISYNKIREKGFVCLMRALREQYLARMSRDLSERAYNLKIIEYTGNPCPEDCFIFRKIDYYLKQSNKKMDLKNVSAEPCSCIPLLRSNLDPDSLLLYDEMVEYFKPKEEESEEESEENVSEWKCCSEFTEIEYESFSDVEEEREESTEEAYPVLEISSSGSSIAKKESEEVTSEECKDSSSSDSINEGEIEEKSD